jgi:hypothetical protein
MTSSGGHLPEEDHPVSENRIRTRLKGCCTWANALVVGVLASLIGGAVLLKWCSPGESWAVSLDVYHQYPPPRRVTYCEGDGSPWTEVITYMMEASITNDSVRPRRVAWYALEVLHEGEWVRLRAPMTREGQRVFVEFEWPSGQMRFKDYTAVELSRRLSSGPVAPGNTVRGWILLDTSTSPRYIEAYGRTRDLGSITHLQKRFIIRDGTGEEQTVPVAGAGPLSDEALRAEDVASSLSCIDQSWINVCVNERLSELGEERPPTYRSLEIFDACKRRLDMNPYYGPLSPG